MFPYIFMRGGQARPRQIHQKFTYLLQLPSISILVHLCILVVLFQASLISRCTRWPWGETVGFMVLFMGAQAMSSGLLGSSALPWVYQTLRITLITTNASTSMTVDGSWMSSNSDAITNSSWLRRKMISEKSQLFLFVAQYCTKRTNYCGTSNDENYISIA